MLSALGKAEDSLRKLICLRKLSTKFIFKFCLSTRFDVGNSFFGLTQQRQNNNNNELNFGSLIHWAGGPEKNTNKYESIYNLHSDRPNVLGLIQLLNKEIAYCKYSGMYISYDDGELLEFNKKISAERYEKYSFVDKYSKKNDAMINPFLIWCKNLNRRDVNKIVFNPDPKFNNDKYYNTFKNFKYTHEDVNKLHGKDCLQPDDP